MAKALEKKVASNTVNALTDEPHVTVSLVPPGKRRNIDNVTVVLRDDEEASAMARASAAESPHALEMDATNGTNENRKKSRGPYKKLERLKPEQTQARLDEIKLELDKLQDRHNVQIKSFGIFVNGPDDSPVIRQFQMTDDTGARTRDALPTAAQPPSPLQQAPSSIADQIDQVIEVMDKEKISLSTMRELLMVRIHVYASLCSNSAIDTYLP